MQNRCFFDQADLLLAQVHLTTKCRGDIRDTLRLLDRDAFLQAEGAGEGADDRVVAVVDFVDAGLSYGANLEEDETDTPDRKPEESTERQQGSLNIHKGGKREQGYRGDEAGGSDEE